MYICLFPDTLCMPLWVFWTIIVFLLIAVGAALYWFANRSQGDMQDMVSQPSEKVYPEPEAAIDEEKSFPAIKVGDRFLCTSSDGLDCFFVVTDIDEEESNVYGYYEAMLPAGAQAENVDYILDEMAVIADYRLSGGDDIIEVRFDVETDPEELDGYSVLVEGARTNNQN